MTVGSINSVKNVQVAKVKEQKTAFAQSDAQKQESEDKTGLIVAGLAAAAAIGVAAVMIIKGRGTRVVNETATAGSSSVTHSAQEIIQSKPQVVQEIEPISVENIAKKYRIKDYVTLDKLTEINGLCYVDGKLYSGKVVGLGAGKLPWICKYKDGKMVLNREFFHEVGTWDGPLEVSVEREVNGVFSTCSYTFENGKRKIINKWEHSKLVPPEEKYLKAKSIGDISQHSYKEIPEIGCVTRGYNKDFTFYKTSVDAVNPRDIYKKIDYCEPRDSGKFILAVGKNQQGKPVVFYHSPAGRVDEPGRGIRNIVTLATKEDKLSEFQLDLIKAIIGNDKDVLQNDLPLSRAFSVNYSKIDETINIDENTLLNEIAHFSKGRNIDSKTQKILDDFAKMPNDTYKCIFEMDVR